MEGVEGGVGTAGRRAAREKTRVRARRGGLEPRRSYLDAGTGRAGVRWRRREGGWRAGARTVRVEGRVVGQWDRARVEQVVDNLLANAARYGQGGPVDVTVRAHENEAWVEVRDRGIGIAPEQLQRIFERFERLTQMRVHIRLKARNRRRYGRARLVVPRQFSLTSQHILKLVFQIDRRAGFSFGF